MWVGEFKQKAGGDGPGGTMRGMGGDKDGCVKEEKEWILEGGEIIMQQLKHR